MYLQIIFNYFLHQDHQKVWGCEDFFQQINQLFHLFLVPKDLASSSLLEVKGWFFKIMLWRNEFARILWNNNEIWTKNMAVMVDINIQIILYSLFLCTLIVSCNDTTKCSDQGTCGNDGTCVCNENHYGIDCSSKSIFLIFLCEHFWKYLLLNTFRIWS